MTNFERITKDEKSLAELIVEHCYCSSCPANCWCLRAKYEEPDDYYETCSDIVEAWLKL